MHVPRASAPDETSLRAVNGSVARVTGRNRQAKIVLTKRPVLSMASASALR